ncbi:PREDICTED: natural killer cells antigen CD94-like isoform X1 [Myotis brandtii]|uniref:natural killer cells antigen CD94-like isoform X1 n=1 Tax=Myotis brandtii TaxID=109478 RepID=UPI0007045E9D|nr:PREDICTED: natural killer cells antigen CD94-like isoform X1 [Myotis brandtii]
MAAFQSTLWRLISGILGVTCLVLMATLGILLKNALTKQSIQPTSSPGPTTMEPQEGSGYCFCQEKWIGHQNNCYFISNERKTWAESRDFCASQNSSLLQLKNRDELACVEFIFLYCLWPRITYYLSKLITLIQAFSDSKWMVIFDLLMTY